MSVMESIYEQVDRIRDAGGVPENKGISVDEFKRLVGEARTELEVRRLYHWHFASVTGTRDEIFEALAFADRRAEQLSSLEEGVPVYAVA